MKKRMLIMIIFLVILFGVVFSFKAFKNEKIKEIADANRNPTLTVSSAKAQLVNWQQKLSVVGNTRTIKGVNVTTELAGMIDAIKFKPGAFVKKGDLLVQLDIKPDVAKLKSLKATAEFAEITYVRNKKQYRIGALSAEQLASNKADYQRSSADVAEQIGVINKKVIRAPFAGKMGISYVNLGQYLQPGDKITTLETITPIYIDFYIPQTQLSQLKVGQQAHISVDAYAKKDFVSTVTTINPNVETDSRNIEVESTAANQDRLLLPGMFVDVSLNLGVTKHYVTVPLTAINFNSYGDIIYSLKDTGKQQDNKEVWQAIQSFVSVGPARGNQVSVLKGVKAGDVIVTSGGFKLKNNSLVFINNTVQPLANADPHPKGEFE